MPVVRPDIATVVRGYTTAVNDHCEDHKTDDGRDLDDGQDELDLECSQYLVVLSSTGKRVEEIWSRTFSVALHTEELNHSQSDQKYCNPDTFVDDCASRPKAYSDTSRCDLVRQDRQPAESVVPPDRKPPALIHEPTGVGEEGTVDWVQYSQFAQSLDGEEKHGTDDYKANDLDQSVASDISFAFLVPTRDPGPPVLSALPEPTKRPAPIAPPGCTRQFLSVRPVSCPRTDSNHLHMPSLEITLQRSLSTFLNVMFFASRKVNWFVLRVFYWVFRLVSRIERHICGVKCALSRRHRV